MLTENWLGKSGNVWGGWMVVLGNVNNRLSFIFNEVNHLVRSGQEVKMLLNGSQLLMSCSFFCFSWNVNFSNLIFTGTWGKIFLLVAAGPFLKLTFRNYKNN